MKKLVLPLLGLIALIAMSFVQPKGGYKKVGVNLYQAKTSAKMNAADLEALKNVVVTEYKITSFNDEITLNFKKVIDPKTKKVIGFSLMDKKMGASQFAEVVMDKGNDAEAEVTTVGTHYETNPPPPPPPSRVSLQSLISKYTN